MSALSVMNAHSASGALVLAILGLWGATASAQHNPAAAESLFREGRQLLEAQRYAEACPKFEESARLDPSSGVELALGLCFEGLGRTASAWSAYLTAASLARRDGRLDREAEAKEHVARLEPTLSHLTLDVAAETKALPALLVKEDGLVVGTEAWSRTPVDPGPHTVEVTAPGKKTRVVELEIAAGRDRTVSVPVLEDAVATSSVSFSSPTVVTERRRSDSPLRTAGFVTLGAAGASLVGAAVLAGLAITQANEANSACPGAGPTCTSASGVLESHTAGTAADWSTALFVGGGVGLLAGGALVFWRGRSAEGTTGDGRSAIAPTVGPGWLGLHGSF